MFMVPREFTDLEILSCYWIGEKHGMCIRVQAVQPWRFQIGVTPGGTFRTCTDGGQVWETTDSGRSQPLQCWAQLVTNSLFQILFLALDG